MDIIDRIKAVRLQADDGEKMTQPEFAKRVGLTMSSISQMERRKINPTNQTIELICREFDINRTWLETGEGPMKKEKPPLDEVAAIVSEILDVGEDDPFYQFVLDLLRSYQKLDMKSRQVIQRLIQETKDAQG